MPAKEILTKPQLAAHLSVTTRTIESMMKNGRIPVIRLGRAVRFNVAAVEAALTQINLMEIADDDHSTPADTLPNNY